MLHALSSRLEQRVDALALEIGPILGSPLSSTDRRRAEYATFQLQNLWELYVRNFILLSATGKAASVTGPLPPSVPRNYRSREAACHYLLRQTRNRYEPKWYRPLEAIRAATALHISNLGQVSGAIGSTPWPLDDLRLTRNFFAHRSKNSALELRELGWFGPNDVISVETTLTPFGVGGVRRFDSWCASIKVVSKAML